MEKKYFGLSLTALLNFSLFSTLSSQTILYLGLLVLPSLCFGQLKPLAQAVEQAKAKSSLNVNRADDLFTPNGTEKAVTNALSNDKDIYKLTLNIDALVRIRQQRSEYLEVSVPTTKGSVELALVAVNIFAPGVTIETSAPDPNFTFEPGKVICYRGIVKGNQNSLVAVTIYGDEIMGMISDSTGNYILAHKPDKSALATDYAFYDERAVMSEVKPFGCGTSDSQTGRVQSNNPVSGKGLIENISSTDRCIRYLGIYAEVDYKLYQHYGGAPTAQITFLLNQVFAIYENEGMYVRLSGLTIWNIPDPYLSESTMEATWYKFRNYWQQQGHSFPGQLAHLLSNRDFPDAEGIVLWDYDGGGSGQLLKRDWAYSVSASIPNGSLKTFPTYSRSVKVVAHEIGHNIGAHHTHWCGWRGGALDNCASPEGSCSPGPPPPSYGGSIMSYCDPRIYLGFATNSDESQIGDFLRTEVGNASINFSITTIDGIISSVASGGWSAASTWDCGIGVGSSKDASISNGNTVQINFTESAKSLNINGILNFSSSNSILNINNN